jgi:hypothetical protein
MLTADGPLLTESDAAVLLTPGLWVSKAQDCAVDPAASNPGIDSCLGWLRIEPDARGGWHVDFFDDGGGRAHIQFMKAAQANADTKVAPLYVGEVISISEEAAKPTYFAVTPVGGAPFKSIVAIPVTCGDALDGGPVEGIRATALDGRVTECVAETADAVSAAVRSTAISTLAERDEARLLWVRPK